MPERDKNNFNGLLVEKTVELERRLTNN